MSGSIPWDELEKQYSATKSYREELKQMIHSEANAFRAGIVMIMILVHVNLLIIEPNTIINSICSISCTIACYALVV